MRINFFNTKYTDDIVGKAMTFRIPGMEWEDVAQELDIALWLKLPRFAGRNNASERTFAQKVMKNRLLDLVKSANRQKRVIDSYHLVFSELSQEDAESLGIETPQEE